MKHQGRNKWQSEEGEQQMVVLDKSGNAQGNNEATTVLTENARNPGNKEFYDPTVLTYYLFS